MMKIFQLTIALLVLFLIGANIQANKRSVVTPAPAFSISDVKGIEHKFPGKHQGVEIYLFWASWCPYCKALMPHLQSIQIEYGEAVKIYALHIRDDEDPVAFLSENGYDFILLPSADPVMELYGVVATPALFLVDEKGNIRLDLYELIFDELDVSESASHKHKAALKAPYWAARIRQKIDEVLE